MPYIGIIIGSFAVLVALVILGAYIHDWLKEVRERRKIKEEQDRFIAFKQRPRYGRDLPNRIIASREEKRRDKNEQTFGAEYGLTNAERDEWPVRNDDDTVSIYSRQETNDTYSWFHKQDDDGITFGGGSTGGGGAGSDYDVDRSDNTDYSDNSPSNDNSSNDD